LDRVLDIVRGQDARFWLLVALCVALVFTIQAVEQATDGAWPHQRRAARLTPGARAVMGAWSWVALLLLPGLLLAVLNLAILVWRGLPETRVLLLGGLFVGVAWLVFVLVSANVAGLRRFMGQVGAVGPAALLAILLVGDLLLLIALLDVLPSFGEIRAALPLPNR
jgi:hypothetical protein